MQFFSRVVTSRRRFLRISLIAALAADARGALAGRKGPWRSRVSRLKSLPAFLDTLLPEDETSPSATALGVHDHLIDFWGDGPRQRLITRGCGWLDRAAWHYGRLDFASLAGWHREAIVKFAAEAPHGSLPRVFFDVVRQDAFRHYYADARSWPAVGYDGPPQPSGFPDAASPPGDDR